MVAGVPMDDMDSAIRNAADSFHFLSTSHLDIRKDRDTLRAHVKELIASIQEERNARLAAEQHIVTLTLRENKQTKPSWNSHIKLNEYHCSCQVSSMLMRP